MAEVFKLQRPLNRQGAEAEILAYNEDRSEEFLVDLEPQQVHNVFGQDYKVYCVCELEGSQLSIGERVEDEDW